MIYDATTRTVQVIDLGAAYHPDFDAELPSVRLTNLHSHIRQCYSIADVHHRPLLLLV